MEYPADIYSLSSQFYTDYPHRQYPEILVKKDRPYSCLLIAYMEDLFICIPFRSHVQHKYAYHFKTSARSLRCQSGLDYTKSVLIRNPDYLDSAAPAVVDQDEYREAMLHLPRIIREVYAYISDYKDDLNGIKKLHPREWQRRYGRSTLPYFNDFLTNAAGADHTKP